MRLEQGCLGYRLAFRQTHQAFIHQPGDSVAARFVIGRCANRRWWKAIHENYLNQRDDAPSVARNE